MRVLLTFLVCLSGIWAAWTGGACAGDIQLGLPVRCQPGQTCFVQNYVDHDPGPGWQDHSCGHLSYDGHTGTDFRLRDQRQMRQGVAVLAAAAGTVVAVRDGVADVALQDREDLLSSHESAGNGVRIDHGDGWETQYSHLMRGSVQVRPGQMVRAGEMLGLVGLSGRTEFPHVELLVRKNQRIVDPFAPDVRVPCGTASHTLWNSTAADALAYISTGILGYGFADRVLTRREMESGEAYQAVLPTTAPALVFHIELFGTRKDDDVVSLRLTNPAGSVLAEHRLALERNQAILRLNLGKRRTGETWAPGIYQAHFSLTRRSEPALEATAQVEMR